MDSSGANGQSLYYRQTTPFTCGAACMIMALNHLKGGDHGLLSAELDFWRRANAVYMGKGQAGCGPYGLGRLALSLNLKTTLCISRPFGIFDPWAENPQEQSHADALERFDHDEFAREGGMLIPHPGQFESLKGPDTVHIVLTGGHKADEGHWIFARAGDGEVLIMDPDYEPPIQGSIHSLSYAEMDHRHHYMGERAVLTLSL